MKYHLSRITICCSKSHNGSDVMAKRMKLVGTHVEEPAILTIMRIKWLWLLVSCWLSCCGSWHPTFPSTPTFPSASRNVLTLHQENPLFLMFPALATAAALRRCRALASLGSSRVSKAAQVLFTQWRSCWPKDFVICPKIWRVDEVWSRSFARACHVHNTKRRLSTILLCGSGNKPSKTGIEH